MDIKHLGRRSALAIAIASVALAGCDDDNGSNGGGVTTGGGGDVVISAIGGNGGDRGRGGYGGEVELYKRTGAGDVTMVRNGLVNAAFKRVKYVPNLGSNPLEVTANTVIAVATGDVATGVAYLGGNAQIFVSDGDEDEGDETPVTGIHVAEGVQLTLPPVYNYSGPYGSPERAELYLSSDLHNEGVIAASDSVDGERSDLRLSVAAYVGGEESSINTSGVNDPADTDQLDAGFIWIDAELGVINDGDLSANGGNRSGGDAGYGAEITVRGGFLVQNTGALSASGGTSTNDLDGAGRNGGDINIYAAEGYVHNSGALTTNGGDGVLWTGHGGEIDIRNNSFGNTYNSGALTANGGDAIEYGGEGGAGSYGGYIRVGNEGGHLRNSGAIEATGGDSSYGSFNGGSGGYVDVSAEDGYRGEAISAGNVAWSGAVTIDGGNASADSDGFTSYGGYGGEFDIGAYTENATSKGTTVALYGYSDIVLNGGTANYGGEGGGVYVTNDDGCFDFDYGYYYMCLQSLPGGSVDVSFDLAANGGNASDGDLSAPYGGEGGYLYISADGGSNAAKPATVRYQGSVSLTGGNSYDSYNSYNSGGSLWVSAQGDASLIADIVADGGADSVAGGPGAGGEGGYVYVSSILGAASLVGDVSALGGASDYGGGDGGEVYVLGNTSASQKGTVALDGGDGEYYGGDGGMLTLLTGSFTGASKAGPVTYSAGTGDYPGDEGGFLLNLVCTGSCN